MDNECKHQNPNFISFFIDRREIKTGRDEKQRNRETEKQRNRETEKQRNRETEKQRNRETEKQRNRETEIQRNLLTREIDRSLKTKYV